MILATSPSLLYMSYEFKCLYSGTDVPLNRNAADKSSYMQLEPDALSTANLRNPLGERRVLLE